MNYSSRLKIALIYSSVTGNTKELINLIKQSFHQYKADVQIYKVKDFDLDKLNRYDAIVIGTYSWGNGEIPREMVPLYRAFELQNVQNVVTGIAGTGDQLYPSYCGAVNRFRDMLFVHTQLAATLKVELFPQANDIVKCAKFTDIIISRASQLH